MTTNRRIVVDNATLSGVERLTGRSQTRNLSNIDNDILCFEKLITAILFSDELLAVDDYKTEYRSERLKNFDFISFEKIDSGAYSVFAKDAAEFAKSMLFSFDGSKPAGDAASFFEALRLHPQMRWDVFVSSEYLTLSLLVDSHDYVQYETGIDAAFRNEVNDREEVGADTDFSPKFSVVSHPEIKDIKDFVHALKYGNPNYSGMGSRDLLNRFVFGYGWVAERSHFYNSFAAANNADAFLSPLRDAFCESCCRLRSRYQVNSLLEEMKTASQTTVASIVEPSGDSQFVMRTPFFSAYYISMADNPEQCIERALSDRDKSEFRDCRVIFHNLAHLSTRDRYKEVNGMLKYLQQSCDSLMKGYAVSSGSGPQVSLSLGLTGVNLNLSFGLGRLFRAYKYRPVSRVFRNIAVDMLNVERLGHLHDKLRSSVRAHKDAGYSKIPTTPHFMENRESGHGRPAAL